MGQYELAKERSEEIWLREARQWATMFFPTSWIDSHLTSFIEGKRLRLRRSRASAAETSTSTMVKDRRVAVEGQDLPCVRSDAADSATTAQAREGDRSHSSSGNTTRPLSFATKGHQETDGNCFFYLPLQIIRLETDVL